jgi:hypothetical protein
MTMFDLVLWSFLIAIMPWTVGLGWVLIVRTADRLFPRHHRLSRTTKPTPTRPVPT